MCDIFCVTWLTFSHRTLILRGRYVGWNYIDLWWTKTTFQHRSGCFAIQKKSRGRVFFVGDAPNWALLSWRVSHSQELVVSPHHTYPESRQRL